MNKQLLIFLCVTFFSLKKSNAQTIDNELWGDIKASKRLFTNVDMGFGIGIRMNQGMSNVNNTFLESSVIYEVINNLKSTFTYRHIIMPNGLSNYKDRFALDLSYKIGVGKFDLTNKLLFQEDIIPSQIKNCMLRDRLKLEYNTAGKVDPFLFTELFYNTGSDKEFEQFRLSVGLDIDLPKKKVISVFYILKDTYNVDFPGSINIVGLAYNFGKIKFHEMEESQ